MRQLTMNIFLFSLITVVSLFMFLPILFTVLGAFSTYWGTSIFSAGFTLQWFREVFHYYGHTFALTLTISLLTVIINICIGTISAYLLSKSKSNWGKFLEEILTLPIAIPGVAIALALIQTHTFLRVSGVLILVGHVIVTFPLMFRTVLGTLRTMNLQALDESASCLGAGPIYRFIYIILPTIKASILSGAIMVFMLSLGEFNMTFFLYTPLNMTLPVGLYEAYASLRIEVGSAFTVIFLIIAAPLMYTLHKLNNSSTLSKNGGV